VPARVPLPAHCRVYLPVHLPVQSGIGVDSFGYTATLGGSVGRTATVTINVLNAKKIVSSPPYHSISPCQCTRQNMTSEATSTGDASRWSDTIQYSRLLDSYNQHTLECLQLISSSMRSILFFAGGSQPDVFRGISQGGVIFVLEGGNHHGGYVWM
jgi:hypothetical protein